MAIDLHEIVGIIGSSLITLLILRFEFRKTRELDIYYQTFETLVWFIPEVERLCDSLQLTFHKLQQINDQLLSNEFGDFLIVRPLGEDVDCLEYYINTHEKVLLTIGEVESLTRKISYLSHNFKTNSKSRDLLTKLALEPQYFIDDRYGKTIEQLRKVKHDYFIFPENFSHVFPKKTGSIGGIEVEYTDFRDFSFEIDNLEEIMNHFNKNNFK